MSDSKGIRFLWMVLSVGVILVMWKVYTARKTMESFVTTSDITEDIIDLYYKNLQRAPTSKELEDHVDAITNNEYDYREIELRLINSDEYQRLIKTQTNLILPETKRVVEEKDLVEIIARVYQRIRSKELQKAMFLPLKDMYIYFQYNLYKFVAFLRDKNYAEFEELVSGDKKMTRESLIDLYLSMFDDSKLNYDANALEQLDASLPKGKRLSDLLTSEGGGEVDKSTVDTAALLAFLKQNIQETKKETEGAKAEAGGAEGESDYDKYLKSLVTSAGEDSCTASQRVYLPNESKILKTDYGFNVLHKFPPVCVPFGKANQVSESVMFSKLQGTPLEEAKETGMGSIMPKFEYRRYIEVPVPGTTKPPTA